MPSTFFDRIAELGRQVPKHSVTAKVEVDQVYAHYQHEGLDFNHPRGGQAKYLEQPWLAATSETMGRFARALLEPDGLERAGVEVAEKGSEMVQSHAPVEFNNLRQSGHPTVQVDGVTVYDRPPVVHRLSEAELRVLGK